MHGAGASGSAAVDDFRKEDGTMRTRGMLVRAVWVVSIVGPFAAPMRAAEPKDVNWSGFRGNTAEGIARGFSTPTTWDVNQPKNVKWKTPIPGLAHSSPVIWGDRLFVTTAIGRQDNPQLKVGLYGSGDSADDVDEHRWQVICLDKRTGKIMWTRTAHKGIPKVKRHTKSTHANSTPSTDGKHVVAFFGSEGLYCYTTDGKLEWSKDLGTLDAGPYNAPGLQWGFASSPVVDTGRVFVQCDVFGDSFVAAFDIDTGKEMWRTPRKDVSTWSTPTVFRNGRRGQLIANGWKHIGGYDLDTGEGLWKLTGGGDVPVPTPVIAHGLIYVTNAHGRSAPLYAIRPDAYGDISLKDGATANEHIAWSVPRNGAYMQTPLVYGDYLYSCSDRGVLKCFAARTGELAYQQRLGQGSSGFSASPVAADDKLYFTSEDGDVFVIRPGSVFKLLGVNTMGEICMATPAISEGALFYRTRHHVVAIADLEEPPAPKK
jgi:outer membrane protein assembly factor BamB